MKRKLIATKNQQKLFHELEKSLEPIWDFSKPDHRQIHVILCFAGILTAGIKEEQKNEIN